MPFCGPALLLVLYLFDIVCDRFLVVLVLAFLNMEAWLQDFQEFAEWAGTLLSDMEVNSLMCNALWDA